MKFTRPLGWGIGIPPQGWYEREHLLPGLLQKLDPAWWYNWSPCLFSADAHPGYVPMLWSGLEALRPDTEQLRATIANHPNHIWQFLNEPESAQQANISPARALDGLKAFIRLVWDTGVQAQYAAPGVVLSPKGLAWFSEFMRLCRRHLLARPGYVTVHPYLLGRPATQAAWDAMLNDFWAQWSIWTPSVPVVFSEVCALGHTDIDVQKRVMDMARETLATDERVVGVAWFAGNDLPGNPFEYAVLSRFDGAESETVSLTELGEYWKTLA